MRLDVKGTLKAARLIESELSSSDGPPDLMDRLEKALRRKEQFVIGGPGDTGGSVC